MGTTPWYKDFFGEDYLRIYTPFLSSQRTEQEVISILDLLHIPTGGTILDLCCGNGRHAIPLAQRGYQITGQDLSRPFLQEAQHNAEQAEVKIRWVAEDMRHIPFANEFDAVINIFTAFGYLENEEEDQKVLQQIYQALKPEGVFLLETVHQPKVVRSFTPHGIIRYQDGLIVLEERRLDLQSSRNEVHITLLHPDGQRTEHQQSMRIYTLTELTRMLAEAGLEVLASYGNLQRGPVTMDSRLVILSQKRA